MILQMIKMKCIVPYRSNKVPLLLLVGWLSLAACVPVKPYQRAYLDDRDMRLDNDQLEVFETNFQSYREGASGANGGKTGGGCGCN